MGSPKSIRFDDSLETRIKSYLKKNPAIKLAKLVNLAVEKFISEPQVIELAPVDSVDWKESAKSAFKKHKKTMDELK